MFDTYAQGQETASSIAEELRRRGVTTAPSPRRPSAPIATSHVNAILGSRYYIGVVTFDHTEYPGQHEPLISEELFARVQEVRQQRHTSGVKPRVHNHYLKGVLYCGNCGEPLTFERTRNRVGEQYDYFYCLGRQRRKNGCTFRAIQAHHIEDAVIAHWATVRRTDEQLAQIRADIIEHIDAMLPKRDTARTEAARKLSAIIDQSQKLLEAHYADAISIDHLKREQDRLAIERSDAERILAQSTMGRDSLITILDRCLLILRDAQEQYRQATDAGKRELNDAVFERLYVHEDNIVASDYQPEFAKLTDPDLAHALRSERKHPLDDLIPTSVLSTAQRSVEIATEVENSPNSDTTEPKDLPSHARRNDRSNQRPVIWAIERPRGRLPWEKERTTAPKDRGSFYLTM
ncbi:MAG: recombinase family protein, partial [Gordonia sp. (in: high G+C Gram-positive bacteria)]